VSSSKIHQIFQKVGLRIDIRSFKALLKELGFNWNGPACSITQLLTKLKEYLNPHLSVKQSSSAITYKDEVTASTRTAIVG
jgi:hypothetical protein